MAASALAASAAASQSLRNHEILDTVGTTAAALSLTGSSFIVLCYLLFHKLHKFSFKLVYFLAVAALLAPGHSACPATDARQPCPVSATTRRPGRPNTTGH
ncbi:G-protein coupled receptor 1-like [Triticum urartu]|uniref:G-protein coupled receptor 1-like n=1 Tax=Triticum urartu TaxID=4572 RepID=UPI0020443EB4|nr:G-protein coupled receptor 1-like [Triticum urartu]